MLPAFFEAIQATTQPCTLLLLLPPIVMAIVTRGRWVPFVAVCVGAVLGGWLFVANVVALDGWQLQLSGVLVAGTIAVMIAAPNVSWLGWATRPLVEAILAAVVSFTATLWWRPCVGVELGAILTASRQGLPAQLPGITAYMLGAMAPVLAVVFALRAIDPSPTTSRRAALSASAVGLVVAGALAIGRHDDLVATLTRWTVR